MIEKIKKLFEKKKKKTTYTTNLPDWIGMAYWVLILSIGIYLILRFVMNQKIAAPFIFMIPAFVGVFFVFVVLPVRVLNFIITEIVLRVRLFRVKKDMPEKTVIVIGKNEYLKPSFWTSPNYGMELLLIINYLRIKGDKFSMYYDSSIKTIDKIMANKKVRTVFFVGHGRRHGFKIDEKTALDYCRYDNPKYKKDFVYQIHCNQGMGKSLVEYVVPKENWKECMPEHGYMSNITISKMFIDKIIAAKELTGYKALINRLWYQTLTMIIPMAVFFIWIYSFSFMITI